MNPTDAVWMMFWMFQAIKLMGIFTGFFSKREYYSLQLATSCLGLIGSVLYELISGFDWQLPFVGLWIVIARLDYKTWKKHKDDDDDEHRKKRWSWAKNLLPKPKTRTIPQPI